MSSPVVAAPQSDAGSRADPFRRLRFRQAKPTAARREIAASPDAEGDAATERSRDGARRILSERTRLITHRQAAVHHLGGLAFELHRRNLLEQRVLCLRASAVAAIDDSIRDIDHRLRELERLREERRGEVSPPAPVGCCLPCRTPFETGARFCWQCGAQVVPDAIVGDDQPTAVIDDRSGR